MVISKLEPNSNYYCKLWKGEYFTRGKIYVTDYKGRIWANDGQWHNLNNLTRIIEESFEPYEPEIIINGMNKHQLEEAGFTGM